MEHRLQEKQRAELLKLAAMLDERQTLTALRVVQALTKAQGGITEPPSAAAQLCGEIAQLNERQTQNALSFVQAMNGCEELPKQDCNS